MYIPFTKFALLALPLVSAVPLDLSSTIGNAVNGQGLTRALSGDSVTDLLKNGLNLVDQVNAALGNILPSPIDNEPSLETTLSDIREQLSEIYQLEAAFAGLLQAVVAYSVPTDIPTLIGDLHNFTTNLNNAPVTIENVAQLLLNGLSVADLTQNVLSGYALSDINSYMNNNPAPRDRIYPQKARGDAPYDIPEQTLRAAIYIPPAFTYGKKRPILFVPGTGAFGGVNFISNLGKLLGNDERFDPVYLNVPGAMYNDTQINSEYIAYAINYLGSITGNKNNLAVIPWSQGNPDTQWAFQYWPSTRLVVDDLISISGDLHGTVIPYLIDPAFPNVVALPPSLIQQEYESDFTLTLRYGGGGTPYVPSTSVWSTGDEIVQPQYSPYASAMFFAQDLPGTPNTTPTCPANRAPYLNAQVQTVCNGRLAGGPYTHEGVLYNPLAYALTLDALTHPGPADLNRIDLDTVCNQLVAPGLSAADVAATEGLIPLAALNLLLYPEKVLDEPAVRQYALQANAQRGCQTPGVTAKGW